jgi:hypothetical protein
MDLSFSPALRVLDGAPSDSIINVDATPGFRFAPPTARLGHPIPNSRKHITPAAFFDVRIYF